MTDTEKEAPPSYADFKPLKSLGRLIPERLSLKQQEKSIKERVKEIDELVMPLLFKTGLKSVLVGDEPVTLVEGTASYLNKKRLIEIQFPCTHCGKKMFLPPEVLLKATEKKDRAPYLAVGRRERKTEGEE